jgi:hypothetical protein
LDALKVAPPHFPAEFIGGFAEMKSLFYAIAQQRGYPVGYSARIWAMLPAAIGNLPCFLDSLTGLWRYECGEPIMLDTSSLIGTPMFPEVEKLFDVVGCAQWRLGTEEQNRYLTRLTDKAKHEDTLTEFAPILRLSDDVKVTNEVTGAGPGNASVDWCIEAPGQPPLLLEVKNRVRDLIESFEAIRGRPEDQPIPAPSHDHKLLFRSVEKKFGARKPTDAIHGVWIKTGLMQEENDLKTAFEALEPGHVHVVVLGTWDEDAYVLATDSSTKRKVLRILRLRQSRRLIFKRPA